MVNSDISNLAKEKGVDYWIWIGIHDKTIEGKFTYESDSKPIVWTNWGRDEPSRRGGEASEEDAKAILVKAEPGLKNLKRHTR